MNMKRGVRRISLILALIATVAVLVIGASQAFQGVVLYDFFRQQSVPEHSQSAAIIQDFATDHVSKELKPPVIDLTPPSLITPLQQSPVQRGNFEPLTVRVNTFQTFAQSLPGSLLITLVSAALSFAAVWLLPYWIIAGITEIGKWIATGFRDPGPSS